MAWQANVERELRQVERLTRKPLTPAALARIREAVTAAGNALKAIDPAALKPADRTRYDVAAQGVASLAFWCSSAAR